MTKNPLNIAVELAKEAGHIQMHHYDRAHQLEFKGVVNIVTEVDKECERLVVGCLQSEFPSHDILAEEGSGLRKDSEYRWIIDPLDGTVNYNHKYPFFGPSIALEKKGEIVLAVVFDPTRDELFIAEKGGGSELNGRKINVTEEQILRNSVLATGFAYNVAEGEARNNLEHFGRFIMETRAIRRDGMAEGDLCYVACGRFDGFWELYLRPWDIAAGTLIIREAGGKVTDFAGDPVDIYGNEIVASNGHLHNSILEVLNRKKG